MIAEDATRAEWILASKALAMLESHYGGSNQTKLMLADRLRDGRLRARADILWDCNEEHINDAWNSNPEDDDHTFDTEIEPIVWRRSRRWPDELAEWRWPVNKFSVTFQLDPLWRTMIQKVMFWRADVQQLIKEAGPTVKKGAGGRRPEEEAWVATTIALLQIERDKRLNKLQFPTQTTLRNELLGEIGDQIKDSTLIKRIRQIYKRFVDPNPSD